MWQNLLTAKRPPRLPDEKNAETTSVKYTMSGEKRGYNILGITLTNLDTVSYFLARTILILQPTKILEKLAQHCNIVTWR